MPWAQQDCVKIAQRCETPELGRLPYALPMLSPRNKTRSPAATCPARRVHDGTRFALPSGPKPRNVPEGQAAG